MDKNPIPSVDTGASKVSGCKMRSNYHRYLAEFSTGDDKNNVVEDARVEHAEATKVTKTIGRHPSHADGTASVSTAAEHSAVELHLTVTGSNLR